MLLLTQNIFKTAETLENKGFKAFLQGIRPTNFGIPHLINPKSYRSYSPYNKITEKCFLLLSVILLAFATPDKLFCSILRYQSVALEWWNFLKISPRFLFS